MCNIYGMKRTTVFIDAALLRRARGYARRQGKSFAQAVREALAEFVARQNWTSYERLSAGSS